jgi:hypothetical protein
MKPTIPFLIGGLNCQEALRSLELLMRNALMQKTGVLNTIEDLKRGGIGDTAHLTRKVTDLEDEVACVEEFLFLIPQAKGGTAPKDARRKLAVLLRQQAALVPEKAKAYTQAFPGARLEILVADTQFLELLARIIDADA